MTYYFDFVGYADLVPPSSPMPLPLPTLPMPQEQEQPHRQHYLSSTTHSVPQYHMPVVGHFVSLTNSPFPNEYASQGGSVNAFDVNAQMFYQHEGGISEIMCQQQQLSLTEEQRLLNTVRLEKLQLVLE